MLLKPNQQKVNFPDLLILGAAKSGTTSLAFYLKQHPDVHMPRKEPGFFAYYGMPYEDIPSEIRDRQIVDIDAYAHLYRNVREDQKICDASVAQFSVHKQTIVNAKRFYGDRLAEVPAFIVLRNPVDRAYSHYLMFLKNGLEDLSFEEAILPDNVKKRVDRQLGFDYLGGSMYADRIRDLQQAFPNLTVYLTSDLRDTDGFLGGFLERCGLRTDVDIDTKTRLNPSGVPKNKSMIRALQQRSKFKELMKGVLPDKLQFRLTAMKSAMLEKSVERVKIDPELKSKLIQEYFIRDIESLESLIGRDLSAWKSS